MSDPTDRLRTALADRYTIERELGRGGMATVHLAEDLKHRRKVAIKVLRPELAATLGVERFLREIEIAANLTHPHILALYDSGEVDGFLYYVMPYIEGESLRDRLIREHQLPIDDSVSITHDVAAALSHAHRLGVIHRDIKPENILLSAGEAVVADFGIARAVSAAGGDQLTETGMAVGTPAYMSPEQATADAVDGRSDVYSLGCVLYEMLGGEPPYTGATPKAVLARKLTDPVPSLRALRETVEPGLEQTTQKALAKAPVDRFQTASAFAEALKVPTAATPMQQTAAPATKQPSIIALAAVFVLVVVFSGWWVIDQFNSGDDRIERLVVLPPANLMRDSTQNYFIDGIHDELIAKLNQIPGLDVIGRTSAARYRNTDLTAPEIAAELSVDAVLESSILKSGDSVRIQVQLIEPFPRERHLWQSTFNEPYRDILALHSHVALAVAEQIQVALTPQQQERLSDTSTVNPEVYEAVLVARHLLERFAPDDSRRAIGLLEHAIGIDSCYAPAHAWLATAYTNRGSHFGDLPPSEAFPQAIAAADAALRHDSTYAKAHEILGRIRWIYLWDRPGAESALRRAIELDSNSAEARLMYAGFLRSMGHIREARPHILRAVELDPSFPMTHGELSLHYLETNQLDSAEASAARSIELDPGFINGYFVLGRLRAVNGDYGAAIELLERGAGIPIFDGFRAWYYVASGDTARGVMFVDSMKQRPQKPHIAIARVHAILGEDAEAFEWLERGMQYRDSMMVWLWTLGGGLDPLSRLRSDPRFQSILQRLGFAP